MRPGNERRRRTVTALRRLSRALVAPDVRRLAEANARLRARHGGESNEALAARLATSVGLRVAFTQLACAIPGGVVGVGCGALAELVTSRARVHVAARIALLREPDFFERTEDGLERLGEILAGDPAEPLAHALARIPGGLLASAVKRSVRRSVLAAAGRLAPRVSRPAVARALRLLPILGGAASAVAAGTAIRALAAEVDRALERVSADRPARAPRAGSSRRARTGPSRRAATRRAARGRRDPSRVGWRG